MILCDLADIHSESDVEQKIIMPLLNTGLGFDMSEIRTKEYLVPTEIDKGAGKKKGYYPDYVLYLYNVPIVVIEVKDLSEKVEAGYREARLYAVELNKAYPSGLNPVRYVMATNGNEFWFGDWDTEGGILKFTYDDIEVASTKFDDFKRILDRDELQKYAQEIRVMLLNFERVLPIMLIGGPGRRNAKVMSNQFAVDIAPALNRYFNADASDYTPELLKKLYCTSEDLTKYEKTLENLIRGSIRGSDGSLLLVTNEDGAAQFDDFMMRLPQDDAKLLPMILIVGGKGVGKSMFLNMYSKVMLGDEIKNNSLWVILNINESPRGSVKDWLSSKFVEVFAKNNLPDDYLSYDNLEKYFSSQIDVLKRGPYKKIFDKDPSGVDEIIAKKLHEWIEDKATLAKALIDYYGRKSNKSIIVAFDNVDMMGDELQLEIFQAVQWFKGEFNVMPIMSMRDETYDKYHDRPPLDAFLKPFVFRIQPPSFYKVAKRRLELAIDYLASLSKERIAFPLESGATINYPKSNLGTYLICLLSSIFQPKRQISIILQAISGNNYRKALEMFAGVISSGHISESTILSVISSSMKEIPEYLILRAVIKTDYEFYTEGHGYVSNILSIPPDSETVNIFMIPEILVYLSDRRIGEDPSVYPYIPVSDVVNHVACLGHSASDVLWGLERLIKKHLIISDCNEASKLSLENEVRITMSGYCHLTQLSLRTEYWVNIVFDVYFPNKQFAQIICDNRLDIVKHMKTRLDTLLEALKMVYDGLNKFIPNYESICNGSKLIISNVEHARKFLENSPYNTVDRI